MNTLLILLATTLLQVNQDFPHPEFVVKSYPETVMPGDRLYCMVVATNPYSETIHIMERFFLFDGDIEFLLRDSGNQTQHLRFEGPSFMVIRILRTEEIKPGDSRMICTIAINVPPLEDLKDPFWEKLINNLSANDMKLMFCATIEPAFSANPNEGSARKYQPIVFETPLLMKQRPEKEMELIQQWFDDTPKELFPERCGIWRSLAPQGFPMDVNILVKGEKISQGNFIRSNNRYPGHPNAPETWQGWKELEDSLTPSTMRDEIRMARILIQYCDTEDDAVLEELKAWFADMNLIQRSILVRLTRKYEKIHAAVKEYDIFTESNYPTQYLKDVGLLK